MLSFVFSSFVFSARDWQKNYGSDVRHLLPRALQMWRERGDEQRVQSTCAWPLRRRGRGHSGPCARTRFFVVELFKGKDIQQDAQKMKIAYRTFLSILGQNICFRQKTTLKAGVKSSSSSSKRRRRKFWRFYDRVHFHWILIWSYLLLLSMERILWVWKFS